MCKAHSLSILILFIAAAPLFANPNRKDEAIPLRKGKKGVVEPTGLVENKTVQAKSVVAKESKVRAQPSKKLAGLHPHAQAKVQAALKDMQSIGVCPTITSAYRSKAEQHAMYRCSHKYHCRVQRGIFSARKPGTSLHEAGLAVDFAAVAYGKKNNRRLTHDGRKIVKVMQKHGFKWRYGLKDPAHFELEPHTAGYKSEKAAITAAQQRESQRRGAEKKPAQLLSKNKARQRKA